MESTTTDDPRFQGWYHTIDLGDGLVTDGEYDHRPVVDRYGLPESMEGMTALDVGTCNGFFAFEMERRGARVTAIDIQKHGDFDRLPDPDPREGWRSRPRRRFNLASQMIGSNVKYFVYSVYDLSPGFGTFDVVFCGSLLLHLMNPLQALVNIRSVTAGQAIVSTQSEPRLDEFDEPWLAFGHAHQEKTPGEANVYWRFSTPGLERMMRYAGFSSTEALPRFAIPPRETPDVLVVIGKP